VNLDAAAALVLTVIPLQQVRFNLGKLPKTSQFARPNRALQRAGQNFRKLDPTQPLPKATGVALAALSKR
jgi:acyl transferase domain-containing protein